MYVCILVPLLFAVCSIIHTVPLSEKPRHLVASVAEQTGLCLTRSYTPKDRFSHEGVHLEAEAWLVVVTEVILIHLKIRV